MKTPATASLDHSRAVGPLHRVTVGEAMHRGVLTVPLETPLTKVAAMMAKYRVHSIVAYREPEDGGPRKVFGIVSDLDLARLATTEELADRTAGGSATTDLPIVTPASSVQRAAELMSELDVSHVLVVDLVTERPLGMLSTLDVAGVLAGVLPRTTSGAGHVAQLMTTDVVTVGPETPLKEVARLLSERGISGVPVVDRHRVVGVVSETDIVAKERGPMVKHGKVARWLDRGPKRSDRERSVARVAGDAMTSPAITIESWRSAADAATLMLDRDVERLPVLKDRMLVGIVTRADLVRAYSRPDDEIARDVREDVLLRSFWINPGEVDTQVDNGEVLLTGTVDSELTLELLPEAVQRIPGVVAVRMKLAARPAQIDLPSLERTVGPY